MTSHILVAEDDDHLREVLCDNLRAQQYRVSAVADGAAALAAPISDPIDLAILDVMMPHVDGYAVCAELRRRGHCARILMLTARNLEDDVVRGLDAGADDYMVKPYRVAELLARVRALLRRPALALAAEMRFADIFIHVARRELVRTNGDAITLTRTEFDLLCMLVKHRGAALTREALIAEAWQGTIVEPRTVDNFVSTLK